MSTSPEPLAVRFDGYNFWVDQEDGRTLGILLWYLRKAANPDQRARCAQIGLSNGIHWRDMDGHLSTGGLLRGAPSQKPATSTFPKSAWARSHSHCDEWRPGTLPLEQARGRASSAGPDLAEE
jgi:hypothetical protein